jgi:hypothetical protein
MTPQEIFDKVAAHLLTQRKQCRVHNLRSGFNSCAYRDLDGLMCAAGCLIPNHASIAPYNVGFSWQRLPDSIRLLVSDSAVTDRFISALQEVHDEESNWFEKKIKESLRVVAKTYAVDHSILNNYEDL